MPRKVNTFTQFLPLKEGELQKSIIKNDSYFSLIFLGGNYLSSGSLLQRLFGGRDDVALIAGLRLQPDGLLITSVTEPNVVLDKRSIKPGRNTNIPMVLNLLVKIPAYMDSIGFSFKIATMKRSDNFSAALDVLNDTANKSVLDAMAPIVVGKVLGVGKIVKDIFDKLDAVNNNDLIQLATNDFTIPAEAGTTGANHLQEGYLVIFVKHEEEGINENLENADTFVIDDGFGNERQLEQADSVFIDTNQLVLSGSSFHESAENLLSDLTYDETNKLLKLKGKIVANTHLIFKVQRDMQRGENLNALWSKKFTSAVGILANEFDKTAEKLKEVQPRIIQLLNEALALLSEDTSYTPSEKRTFIERYRSMVDSEKALFK